MSFMEIRFVGSTIKQLLMRFSNSLVPSTPIQSSSHFSCTSMNKSKIPKDQISDSRPYSFPIFVASGAQ